MSRNSNKDKASLISIALANSYNNLSSVNYMEEANDYSKNIDDNLIYCEGIIKETYDLLIFLINEKQKIEPNYKHGSIYLGIQHTLCPHCKKAF